MTVGSNGNLRKSLEEMAARRARIWGRKVLGLLERWASDDEPLDGDVGSIMTRNVSSCFGNDTLHRAAQIMWDRDCGAVPVVDAEGRAVGLVTDRDLCMAAYTRGRPLSAVSVSSMLAGRLHTCTPTTSIDEAIARMSAHRVRRLVVIDPNTQRLVGMLALADVARHLAALGAADRRGASRLAALMGALSEPCARGPELLVGQRSANGRSGVTVE